MNDSKFQRKMNDVTMLDVLMDYYLLETCELGGVCNKMGRKTQIDSISVQVRKLTHVRTGTCSM